MGLEESIINFTMQLKRKNQQNNYLQKDQHGNLRYYPLLWRIWDPLGIDCVGNICIASTCLSSKSLNLSIWSFTINLTWYALKNSWFSSSSFCQTGNISRCQNYLFCKIHVERIDNTGCLQILRNGRLIRWIKKKKISDTSFLSNFSLKVSSSSY